MNKLKLLIAYFLFVGILCFQSVLQGQTPELFGWSAQEPLAMSKKQCYDKALEALNSSGLSNVRTLDDWTASASDYNIRAGIGCVSCENGVLVSVSVAATHEYPRVKEMRDYLMNFMMRGATTPDNASYRDINGSWICDYKCPAGGVGSTASFQQNGIDLIIFNEGGQRFTGYLKDRNTIAMHSLSITGAISNDGKKITWSNGTIWVR